MKRYVLHEPFNIYHFQASEWIHPVHNHTYYEIIFILKGKGMHNINGNAFPYTTGDVFLLGPEDYHHFEIKTLTEFCYIRFNESFTKLSIGGGRHWQQLEELLLHTSYKGKGSVVVDQREKRKLHSLLLVLKEEYEKNTNMHFEIIRDSLMRSIMAILARNISSQQLQRKLTAGQSLIEEILLYIRQNINKPALLSSAHLAHKFHHASAYMGIYFKKHTGESLKQYITRHKIKLIEARLLYSQSSLAQIADEFGYTDESHLCKQFRKYNGVTPTMFRKK